MNDMSVTRNNPLKILNEPVIPSKWGIFKLSLIKVNKINNMNIRYFTKNTPFKLCFINYLIYDINYKLYFLFYFIN